MHDAVHSFSPEIALHIFIFNSVFEFSSQGRAEEETVDFYHSLNTSEKIITCSPESVKFSNFIENRLNDMQNI
jgi:hypothetical protein